MEALKKLKSTSAQALMDREFKPRHTVIAPWLRTEETAVIWAASGVGKTMLCLSIALAVAGGGTLADWEAPTPRKILYVDGEMHLQDIKDRLDLLLNKGRILTTKKEKTIALQNLEILARQDQDIGTSFFDLTTDEAQTALIERVMRDKVELLILDNFTTLTDDLDDENDSTCFKKVQDFFLQLKRAGVATILVHHSNKSGKAMRGSTALETTFEVILGLEKPQISSPGQAKFVAKFSKFRGKGDERLADRTWNLADEGWEISEAAPDDPSEDPIFLALKSLQFTNQSQIAKALGTSKSTVSRRLNSFEAHGLLKPDEATELFAKARDLKAIEAKDEPGWLETVEDEVF